MTQKPACLVLRQAGFLVLEAGWVAKRSWLRRGFAWRESHEVPVTAGGPSRRGHLWDAALRYSLA